jgi:phytoene dehydrogenase-like protein
VKKQSVVTLLLLSLLLAFLNNPAKADEVNSGSTDSDISCVDQLRVYLDLSTTYQSLQRKSPRAYKSLANAYRDAMRERAQCVKEINFKFKSDLQGIKSKYDGLKGDRSSNRAVRETQRMSEISAATLARDEAIRSLPLIAALPPAPTRQN